MARQTITAVAITGKWPTDLTELTFTAANATDKEQVIHTGKEILIAFNSGASSRSVTITSVASARTGRTGDLTHSVGAGKFFMAGPLAPEGFTQTNGYLYMEAAHADVKWAVIQVP